MIILLITFGILPLCILSSRENNASVIWDPNSKNFFIKNSIVNNSVAWGNFKDSINETGWSYLEIYTNDLYNDSFQAYAAGLVEGYLTSDLITMHWNNLYGNYCSDNPDRCKKVKEFLEINMNFMNKGTELYRANFYWHQVALILEQVQGLEDAYKKNISVPRTTLNVMDIMLFNVIGDLETIESIVYQSQNQIFRNSGCSALIKLLPNFEDLYVGHATWNSYKTMLRINKKYVFPYKTSIMPQSNKIPGHTMSFSSYPGTILSTDDFYIISSGLVALETTIRNNDYSLLAYIQPNKIILEWIRNIIANRLATSGVEWGYYFELFNSGTYNNQWMIVDYKRLSPGKVIHEGLLVVLEQLPTYVRFADQTELLLKVGYWPSYNMPFFPEIFAMSKTYLDYEKKVRGLIFARDQNKVHNLTTMAEIMRYNNYKNDSLSHCKCIPEYSANYAIAARSDLNLGTGNESFPNSSYHEAFGATDMKLTSYSLQKQYKFVAQAGPTYDQQPPFQWSKSGFDSVPHEGQPDLWMFEQETHEWLNV